MPGFVGTPPFMKKKRTFAEILAALESGGEEYGGFPWPGQSTLIEEPEEEREKKTRTVIKESDDPDVATTYTTTIEDDDKAYETALKNHQLSQKAEMRDIQQGLLDDFSGRDAEHDERGMQDWYAQMAQQAAREEQGTAAPSQEEAENALAQYADFQRQELIPEEQATGSLLADAEAPPQVDPWRFPTGSEQLEMASNKPLYITDEGDPVYMEDLISLGVAGRLKSVSNLAKSGKEAFFKWVSRNRVNRQSKGKRPTDKWKTLTKVGIGTGVAGAGAGVADWLSDEGMLPQHVGGGRFAFIPPSSNETDDSTTPADVVLKTVEESGASPKEVEEVEKDLSKVIGDAEQKLNDANRASEGASNTKNGQDASNDPTLNRIWGSFAQNPNERKKEFLRQLNNIFMKGLMLDMIATFTGGTSQSDAYTKYAIGQLEIIEKFDEEERLYNIHRGVYFDEAGNYDPPNSKKEAYERALRFKASPEEASAIYGHHPKKASKEQYYRVDPKDPTKFEVVRRAVDPGPGWVKGKPSSSGPARIGTEGGVSTEQFNIWNRMNAKAAAAEGADKVELQAAADAYGMMVRAIRRPPAGLSVSSLTPLLRIISSGDWDGSNEEQDRLRAMIQNMIKQALGEEEALRLVSDAENQGTPVTQKVRVTFANKEAAEAALRAGEVKAIFANEEEAEAALRAGKIKKGDFIVIGLDKAEV